MTSQMIAPAKARVAPRLTVFFDTLEVGLEGPVEVIELLVELALFHLDLLVLSCGLLRGIKPHALVGDGRVVAVDFDVVLAGHVRASGDKVALLD